MTVTPDSARDHARTLIKLGRHGDAAAAARSGLAVEPEDPGLMLLLATAVCESGDTSAALPLAERAVTLDPDSAVAHSTLGWVLFKAGRFAPAATQLDRALGLDPDDAETHIMRATVALELLPPLIIQSRRRRERIAEAQRHAAEAVRLEPDSARGYLMHGRACLAAGNAAGAEAWTRQALSVQPDHPVGHQLLGLVAQMRGDPRAAGDHFLDAGRLNPRSDRSLKMLRQVPTTAPLTGVVVVLLVQLAFAAGVKGHAAPAVVATIVAVLVSRLTRSRSPREKLSEDARRALVRDRALRRRWPLAGRAPWRRR